MTDLSAAEQLRRRYSPDPLRELWVDYREALARAETDADRADVLDAALDAATGILGEPPDEDTHAVLEAEAFPARHPDRGAEAERLTVEALREQNEGRDPELDEVWALIDAAAGDPDKVHRVVTLAIESDRWVGDDDVTMALLAADLPTIEAHHGALDAAARLESDDPGRAETRLRAQARAEVTAQLAAPDVVDDRPVRAAVDAIMAGGIEEATADA